MCLFRQQGWCSSTFRIPQMDIKTEPGNLDNCLVHPAETHRAQFSSPNTQRHLLVFKLFAESNLIFLKDKGSGIPTLLKLLQKLQLFTPTPQQKSAPPPCTYFKMTSRRLTCKEIPALLQSVTPRLQSGREGWKEGRITRISDSSTVYITYSQRLTIRGKTPNITLFSTDSQDFYLGTPLLKQYLAHILDIPLYCELQLIHQCHEQLQWFTALLRNSNLLLMEFLQSFPLDIATILMV